MNFFRSKVVVEVIVGVFAFITIATLTYAVLVTEENKNIKRTISEWNGSLFELKQEIGVN